MSVGGTHSFTLYLTSPGVQEVAWSFGLPPDGGMISFGEWQSDVPGAPTVDLTIDRYQVGPEFFALYRIPLMRGRSLEPGDPQGTVVIQADELAQTGTLVKVLDQVKQAGAQVAIATRVK